MIIEALKVAGTGFFIVFLALILLSLSIKFTSYIIKMTTKKKGGK